MGVTLAVVLGLGVAGNGLAADWVPDRYEAPPEFAQVAPVEPVDPPDVRGTPDRYEVTLEAGGGALDALIRVPPAPGPHPAVVLLHGAGTHDRFELAEQADHLARAGIVTLVADKRTADYSPWHRDYEAMSADALAAVDFLRGLRDVDPERIGLFAESEGTWVAPVAAVRDPGIAYTIMVSAPIVSPLAQATYATLTAFEGLDVPDPVTGAVGKGIGLATTLPNVLAYAEFDVLPWVARMQQPTLLIYGAEDPALPIIEAPELFFDATAAPADAVKVRYFEEAQHGIRQGSDGPFAPGYLDLLATWILRDGDIPGPRVAGGQPVQHLAARPAPHPPWYATAGTHMVVIGLAVLGYLAGPVASGAARLLRGPAAARISRERRWSLRLIRLLGAASFILLVGYFVGLSHLALNQLTNAWLTQGGWAVVWLVATAAVMSVLSVWFGPTWRSDTTRRSFGSGAGPPNAVEKIALVGAVTGTVLLLVVVAYGGVFRGV